jgi:hypothetical protein
VFDDNAADHGAVTGFRNGIESRHWRARAARSESGQFQKSDRANAMSAFPPLALATRQRTSLEVRFVPTADSCTAAKARLTRTEIHALMKFLPTR